MFSETVVVEPFLVSLSLPEAYGLIEEAIRERNAQWPMQQYSILPGDQSRGLQRFQATVRGLGDPALESQVAFKNAQAEAALRGSAISTSFNNYKDWVTTISLTAVVNAQGPNSAIQLQYEIAANKVIDLVYKVTKVQAIVEDTSNAIHSKLGSISGAQLYNAATAAMQHGDYQRALTAISNAITEFPHDPDFYCIHGMLLTAVGQPDNAELAYRVGLDLAPRYWRLWFNLGYFYLESKRYPDAKTAFSSALPICDDPETVAEIRQYLSLIEVESRQVQPSQQKAAQDLMQKFEQELEIAIVPTQQNAAEDLIQKLEQVVTEVRLPNGKVLNADSSLTEVGDVYDAHKKGLLDFNPQELQALMGWRQKKAQEYAAEIAMKRQGK
jgi:Flp pilus assembly protein TadD